MLGISCGPSPENTPDPNPYEIQYPAIMDQYLPPIRIPDDNPMTVEGVELGEKLFLDTRLSGDNTMSCASCHLPEASFSDQAQFSIGIDGLEGRRNAMPLVNLGWMFTLLWDGSATSLENQAFTPVVDPVEMHTTWPDVEARLSADSEYPDLFLKAFGTRNIDSTLVSKAIAQFERTLISANSPFDKFLGGLPNGGWTETEWERVLNGRDIFLAEEKGDCFHCHGSPANPLWTDNFFHNNGLDETFDDPGLGGVTKNPADNGKFKTPTLRNLLFTAPYMHDGRFNTLEEVVEHYSTGLKNSPTIDPLMKNVAEGGVQLTQQEKDDLVLFLKSLTDSTFLR